MEDNNQNYLKMLQKQKRFKLKYERQEFLGKGTFGSVFKIRDRSSGQLYAAKFISLKGLGEKEILRADEERLIHSQLAHPNILKFCESYLEGETLIFVMEYCEYGDLQVFLQKRRDSGGEHLPLEVVLNIFIQLLYGLQYLHGQGIIHRDIKPSNIFVDSNGAVKIADFGISKVVNPAKHLHLAGENQASQSLHLTGTPMYSSPETCRNEEVTFKSDIWSLGCVLYELCTLKHAFSASNVLALATMINSMDVGDIGEDYGEDLGALLKWMMEKIPANRPTIAQILGLTFIRKCIKVFQLQKKQQQSNTFKTPTKKLSTTLKSLNSTTSTSTQKSPSPPSSPYPIIYHESQLQEADQQEYYSKLKQSCLNLLGPQLYDQMYHEIVDIDGRIAIVNERDRGKVYKELRAIYGEEYYDLSKAMLELVQFWKGKEVS